MKTCKSRISECLGKASLGLAGALFIAALAILSAAGTSAAQEQPNPAPPAHDMEHMQHNHGGFMQEGMHPAVAKGIKLEQQVDTATHTITVREGPLPLPANTSHMKMPQPPDVFWTIPLGAFLLAYTPRLVGANGNSVPGIVLHHTAFWNT